MNSKPAWRQASAVEDFPRPPFPTASSARSPTPTAAAWTSWQPLRSIHQWKSVRSVLDEHGTPAPEGSYTVKRGDTLSKIAAQVKPAEITRICRDPISAACRTM